MVGFEQSLLKLIVYQGAHINVWNLDKDFEGDEVDNSMLYRVLIEEHVEVDEFRE